MQMLWYVGVFSDCIPATTKAPWLLVQGPSKDTLRLEVKSQRIRRLSQKVRIPELASIFSVEISVEGSQALTYFSLLYIVFNVADYQCL